MEKIKSVKTYTISDALDILNDSLLTNKKRKSD